MTQEDKELLLKDLYARLPYETLLQDIEYNLQPVHGGIIDIWHKEIKLFGDEPYRPVECIRPYLRPMSSMTKEEQEEFVKFHCVNICPLVLTDMLTLGNESKMFDWLNSHHFDYRGLIEKGLALEAPENMYKHFGDMNVVVTSVEHKDKL